MSTTSSSPATSVTSSGVQSRPRTYLVAHDNAISPAGAGPMDFNWVAEQLEADPAVTVEKTLTPRSLTLQATGPSMLQQVLVATIPDDVRDQLVQHPQILLEEDHSMNVCPIFDVKPGSADVEADPTLISPFGTSTEWQLKLESTDGTPLPGATVFLYGQSIPAQGHTDAQGLVSLTLTNESDSTLRALYVNPLSGYWTLWIDRPSLTSGILNTVTLHGLSETFPTFPAQQMLGWGQQAMRLDHVPAAMTGAGVTIAIIDSGAAALTHPDLGAITTGVDLTTTPSNNTNWSDDEIAHGSHCAGVISGADNSLGIRGFAPGATVNPARIFPGGRISSLLDAIDYCMDQQVDVVNMSLGTGGTSQLLLQKLNQARGQGVACIVAAGNSGDAVQFPGNSPDVCTIAAIGHDGTFPEDSYHAKQHWTQGTIDHGFFSAQFSCHGPEVDLCAPGVAIISSVPANGYAAWDGTSMATPHVTGLAALVLAHHPDFQTPALRMRTAARVDRLFEILRASATPFEFGDSTRTGAGLPDALRALGLEASPQTNTSVSDNASAQSAAIDAALSQLHTDLVAAGLMSPPLLPTWLSPPTTGSQTSTSGGGNTSGDTETGNSDAYQRDIQRQLVTLAAQMAASGIPVG